MAKIIGYGSIPLAKDQKADDNGCTQTIKYIGGAGVEQTSRLAPNCKVTINGEEKAIKDLKPTDEVTLDGSPVVAIIATRPVQPAP